MNDTLPPLPRINHPEPHTYRFTDLERAYIEGYAMNYARKALAALAQHREPLTDEQIRREKPVCADWASFRAGVRCAERIHGVGK